MVMEALALGHQEAHSRAEDKTAVTIDLDALVAEAKRLYDGKGMSDGNIRALKQQRPDTL
jgi:hypothetical protein